MSMLTAVFLIAAALMRGQTTSTEISGTVTDPTGAVIPGAKVTLLRIATGERRVDTTSSTGAYSFPLIEIGGYTVAAEMAGFQRQEKTGIRLQLQQKLRIDFALNVGETQEKIEVVSSAVQLKTEDASVGQVIDNKRVVELPLNGRNISTLAVLTPGVQFGLRQGLDGSQGNPIPGRSVALTANGQRENNQQISLDGVTAANSRVNVMIFTPSIDAIEEFKVQTSSYSAEYGQNNGAVVQIALKSGTNQFHGAFFEFLRNDKVAAKDYFLNFQLPAGARPSEKNRLRRNQFGMFLSGPVLLPKVYRGKDRTFWSFNYEGLRQTVETVREGFFFPEEFRRGDFSQLLTPLIRDGRPIRAPIIVHDPLTGEPFRDGTGRITNIIPASRINRNAQNFLNTYMPLPQFRQDDILEANVRAPVPSVVDSNQFFFRIDHTFSEKDKAFFRFARDRSSIFTGNLNPNFTVDGAAPSLNLAFQEIHLFSSRTLNEFRFGTNWADWDFANPRTGTSFDLNSLGIGTYTVITDNNRALKGDEIGLPNTGVLPGDGDTAGNSYNSDRIWQFADNLSHSRGNHGFKAGFELRRTSVGIRASNNPRGVLNCCPGGYNLSGWLMGYLNGSTSPEGKPLRTPQNYRMSAYFLDNWKATRKLTLNIGLRWDYFTIPTDPDGVLRSLRLDILTAAPDGRQLPTLVPAPGVSDFPLANSDNRYFMPRIGLAYKASDKWVIRSGFGWFANAQQLDNYQILGRQPPYGAALNYNQVTDVAQVIPYSYGGQNYNIQTRRIRAGTPVIALDNVFPSGSGTSPARTNLIALIPDNRNSNHWQWSLDLQRALPTQTFLTVSYIGSKTSHLDNNISNFNSPDPAPNTDVNARRPWQAYMSQGEGARPFGLGEIRYLDSYANGSYHGLQTSVEKRYSHGLVAGLSYTYSKAIGEGYERNGGFTYQDPRNRRADRMRYPFDVTQNAVLHYVYEMPFLNRFRGIAGAFLAGWQTNGILTLRTGFPFNVAGGNLNTGGPTRPDRITDGRLFEQATRARWYDPAAFRRTDCNIPGRLDLCHYGNAAQSPLVTPGQRNIDLSLYKNWRMPLLGENGRLQFRGEFFNTFNTPQFGEPAGIAFSSLDSIIPDAPRMADIRSLRLPMRILQFGMKLYF
ncbi:MAG: TonB-dependent receptor [Bryobacterales bacterium]|nr:TonB-dependent receptor [Bryobacterales bacterium]